MPGPLHARAVVFRIYGAGGDGGGYLLLLLEVFVVIMMFKWFIADAKLMTRCLTPFKTCVLCMHTYRKHFCVCARIPARLREGNVSSSA